MDVLFAAPGEIPKSPGAYIIEDPISGKKYIGSTNDLKRRKREHTKELKDGTHHNSILQDLHDKGTGLEFKVIPANSREEAYAIEQKLIDEKVNGAAMVNVATDVKASRKGAVVSEETKAKLSAATSARVVSEETRMKISHANTGRKRSEESRKRTSESLTGRSVSYETRQKLSASNSGKKASLEAIEKNRLGHIGIPMPEKTRLAIRDANVGRKASDIVKAAVSEASSKPVIVNNVVYTSSRAAAKALGISKSTVFNRLESDKYPNWKRNG